MIYKEGLLLQNQLKSTLHPLWEIYQLPCRTFLYFNPYTGQLSLNFPEATQECFGGILVDEMGLGKTVMLISLLHMN